MSRYNFSTPTVSFADRGDFRPTQWDDRCFNPYSYGQQENTEKTERRTTHVPYVSYPGDPYSEIRAYADGRGFRVDEATLALWRAWIKGKL